jgi:beta-galactosidase
LHTYEELELFYYGVDYYPEHWPEDRWETDARLMREAGINVVRLAEFAWSLMEPEDGVFDFAWLDRAIGVLAAQGIRIVLGTPSAAVPPWLWHKIPDIALVNENGVTLTYGSRRDYSPTNAAYREHAVRIARKMAEHYRDNPHVIGWQIDNEFGDRCYCESSRLAFHEWLREKYGSLDALNQAWGTRFWSHVYTEWSQIPIPLKTIHGQHNPGLHLDYYRFMSDVYVEFQQLQVDAIRKICPPEQFVTHNFMGFGYRNINYFDLAASLDFVTWDNYPRGFWITTDDIDPAPLALSHTTMRGLKGKSFWVMEQQSGPGAWDIIPPMPRPGEIALWAYQAIAHGADGIVFFRWRTCRFGTEEYWHGVLDHDGKPRRRYAEVKQMGEQIARAGDLIAGSEVRADVAIVLSYDSRFAFQIQGNNPDFSYEHHLLDYFAAFHRENIAVDIVPPDADLAGYKLVVVPALYVTEQDTVARLQSFAEQGGAVVITPRSGVKDHSNTVVDLALPGLLASLCGVEVAEYDSLLSGQTRALEFDAEGCAAVWCDILEPISAEVIARYDEDYYAGQPAVTLNRVGRGQVIYAGTMGDAAFVHSLTAYACREAGVSGLMSTPPGVEVTARWKDTQRLLFVMNHSDTTQIVDMDSAYHDLLADAPVDSVIQLDPKQVAILV